MSIKVGSIVKIVKAAKDNATERFIGKVFAVAAVTKAGVKLARQRGRYAGAAAYTWPLASLKLSK